jgi:hypothetical protein
MRPELIADVYHGGATGGWGAAGRCIKLGFRHLVLVVGLARRAA